MAYRKIITLDMPDSEAACDAVVDVLEKLDDLDVIVREEGFPTHTVQRFAVVRWLGRRVADVRFVVRRVIQGESDAMRSLRLLKEDLAAVDQAR